ncbi:MAG: hypothetical protein IT531_06495 [Burkholderiales bacterium]|nr:hypothetical protein [Burkholderiales bacterium]
MTSDTFVLDPTAPSVPEAKGTPWRLDALQGKVVGFIDNAKPNFDHLAAALAAVLVSRHGVARVVTTRKRAASVAADRDALDQLARECDLVISGSGD